MPRVRAAVRPLPADAPPAAPAPAEVPSSMPTRRPPIRRAASTVPALPPTPPRTTHKRKRRSRSRVTDSSSEEEDEHEVPQPESDREDDASAEGRRIQPGAVAIGHKKRKTKTLDAIAEELSEARVEEQFWMGPSGSSAAVGSSNPPPTTRKVLKNRAPTRARSRSRTRSPSSSPPPAPHLLRRGHTGLMSPPPSRRAPAVVPRPATPPPTVRTKRIKSKAADLPQRDSPNNPFLAESVPASEDLSSPEPPAPQKHVEKPTMSVVFRGVKAVISNPHYVPEKAAAEKEALAHLPVQHPEYESSIACPPTLLFPEARKRDLAARRRAHPSAGPSVPIPDPTSIAPTPAGKHSRASSTSSDASSGAARATGGKRGAAGTSRPSNSRSTRSGTSAAKDEAEDEEAVSAALVANIARRMRKGVHADGEAPQTRPSSRIGELPGIPVLPEKDRSDPIKRALGPMRRA